MSERDKEKMRRLAADLDATRVEDPGTVEQRRRFLAFANLLRERVGAPPLPDEEEDPPELEFYRRAESLGMVARRRRTPR